LIFLLVMLKAYLQRPVRLGHVARQFSTVTLMRNARFNARAENTAILRQVASQSSLFSLSPRHVYYRPYSAESAAAQANREAEFAPVPSAPVTRFADLSSLGVNEHLVNAITQGMGYENMTEVQSMTINSALKGTDM
jgi:ATP-dependent RNA helicase MSS116, mitochondrial